MVLDWLSGGPSTPGGNGERNLFVRMYNGDVPTEQTTNMIDPPETPAHLFPLRAFKQAIFGTPRPLESVSTRLHAAGSTDHLLDNRTAKTDQFCNTADLAQRQEQGNGNGSSPSKRPGILLTPGTGVQRRKTVSFGDGAHKLQNATDAARNGSDMEAPSKMQQSTSQNQHVGNPTYPFHGSYDDSTVDIAAPRSASGLYWKREYERAREESALEVRKLVKKEQIAKKFARQKDIEVQGLVEKLQREAAKVTHLETQLADYVTRLACATSELTSPNRLHNDLPVPPRLTGRLHETLDDVHSEVENLPNGSNIVPRANTRSGKPKRDYIGQAKIENTSMRKAAIADPTKYSVDSQLRTSLHPGTGTHAQAKNDVSKNIWTDRSTIPRDSTRKIREYGAKISDATKSGQPNPARSPLQARVANAGTATDRNNSKESALSAERREAARKRLQDKRRTRAAAAPTGQ